MKHCGYQQTNLAPATRRWSQNTGAVLLATLALSLTGFTDVFSRTSGASNENLNISVHPTPIVEEMADWYDPFHLWPHAPRFTEQEQLSRLNIENILDDHLNRISAEFKVPKGLEERVGFWFDIYTKHGQFEHVIHHTLYPWVIYKVIDGRDIVATSKGPLWLRQKKIISLVVAEKRKNAEQLEKSLETGEK